MHQSGCFVLPNLWDIGTTIYLERLGFKALATTSAGFAFSRGKSDGAVPRDEMLAHIREIVAATALPMNRKASRTTCDSVLQPALLVYRSKTTRVAPIRRSTRKNWRSSGFVPRARRLTIRKLAWY